MCFWNTKSTTRHGGRCCGLQAREFQQKEAGYHATRHQRFVGAGYFDQVAQCISGGRSSTTALSGSTEEAQFAGAHH